MTKSDYYEIYQKNIKLLEQQIAVTKRSTQILLGEKGYKEKINQNTESIQYEILATTRLYSFLMCSWFEARLYKMLYEGSSEGFTESEINKILGTGKKPLYKKWTDAYNFAICKKYGFTFGPNQDYSNNFSTANDSNNYKIVITLLNTIEKAIEVRNKLAHGQWHIPLTGSRKNIATDIDHYLTTFDNIQKLHYQHQTYKLIAEIIHDIVVSKLTYERDFDTKMQRIKTYQTNIRTKNFSKYCKPYIRYETKKRNPT